MSCKHSKHIITATILITSRRALYNNIPIDKGLMSIDIPQTLTRVDVPLTNNAVQV